MAVPQVSHPQTRFALALVLSSVRKTWWRRNGCALTHRWLCASSCCMVVSAWPVVLAFAAIPSRRCETDGHIPAFSILALAVEDVLDRARRDNLVPGPFYRVTLSHPISSRLNAPPTPGDGKHSCSAGGGLGRLARQ